MTVLTLPLETRKPADLRIDVIEIDQDTWYDILKSRNRRFDGRYYNGVKSTGIYCRTICPARTPLKKNCTLFLSAAAAEAAGYRPCLRCRPELAPGFAPADASQRLAKSLASRLANTSDVELDQLAAEYAISTRHMRRVFQECYGVSPNSYRRTARLLMAKKLLTETSLPITEIAFLSGYASLRSFQRNFRDSYHMTPTRLRQGCEIVSMPDSFTLSLTYRPPFPWDELLGFLKNRCLTGIEAVVDDCYLRSLQIFLNGYRHAGWIRVSDRPRKAQLQVEISASLRQVLPVVLDKMSYLFDLDCDPETVSKRLGSLAEACPGLRVPGSPCGLELATRAVLGQLISVQAAKTLTNRLVDKLGTQIDTPHPQLYRLFPTTESLALAKTDSLGQLGITRSKAKCILALAKAVQNGELSFSPNQKTATIRTQLLRITGIGPWTMEYISMRALGWPDAFPASDHGVRTALGLSSPKAIESHAQEWQPFRAYAVMFLWQSLAGGTFTDS